ncbi:MAG: hypothetical protein O4804_08910 [Trichodesmium sp. St11_bin5]|nr:hypothetical protein [Trichodesmium sp. St11_bin5]
MSEILLAPIEFELPELSRLKILWEYFLFEVVPRSQVINYQWLAQRSTELGGGDIWNLVRLTRSSGVSRISDI